MIETKDSDRPRKKYPKPTEHVVSSEPFEEEITDSKGKKQKIKGENQTTILADAETLYKLGEMIFVSPQTKKIYFIPFSIQFGFEQFVGWLVKIRTRLEQLLEEWSEDGEEKN